MAHLFDDHRDHQGSIIGSMEFRGSMLHTPNRASWVTTPTVTATTVTTSTVTTPTVTTTEEHKKMNLGGSWRPPGASSILVLKKKRKAQLHFFQDLYTFSEENCPFLCKFPMKIILFEETLKVMERPKSRKTAFS